MPRLIRWDGETAFEAVDSFRPLADDEALGPGDLILSMSRFQAEGVRLIGEGRRIGVVVAPNEAVEALAYDLVEIALVALEFPKFRDGRAFSSARILREQLGWKGELRAVGEVLLEQAKFMIRCGFDAFEPADGTGPGDWTAASRRFRHVYQRASDGREPAFVQRARVQEARAEPTWAVRDEGGDLLVRQAPAPTRTRVQVRARPQSLAERLDAELRDCDPIDIIAAARERFGEGELALVSSFGAESAVLLHMAAEVDRDMPVLFLDTGMLFAQTLDYRRELAGRLGLTGVVDLRPRFEDLATVDPTADLWRREPDACCKIRKVRPLDAALGPFEAWITGRKRFHGGERLRLKVVEEAEGRLKFNPLAGCSKAELEAYARRFDLPAHPLLAMGFPSIGCWPCTEAVEDGADLRAGRWSGSQKSECGIHTARAPGTPPPIGGEI